MLKNTLFSLITLAMIFAFGVNLYSQQCEISVADINYESANSLTFDVLIKNTGTSNFVFSNGSLAWTYDTAILNGGTASFSLVPGYSDFPASAYPPSALITSPNILRTSSNLPGSNGVLNAGQSLRLYRFRLQTSASSFASENFSIRLKNSVTPYTRVYSWDASSELPVEIQIIKLQENAWINEFHYDNTGGDVGEFVEIVIENPGLYTLSDFQVNLYNGNGGASYGVNTVDQFTVGSTSGNFTFYYWNVPASPGIQNGAPDGLALSYQGTVITGQFISYEGSFMATNGPANDVTSTDIGVLEAGSEPIGNSLQLGGTGTQYSDFTWNAPASETKGTPNIGQTFSSGSGPIISVTPTSLSGFSYIEGGGPSTSQSYNLSGSDLDPVDGDIVVTIVTSPYSYEVSLDDETYSSSVNVGYTGGTLDPTPIYVRLKEGLPGGENNGELIENSGGGATTQNVLCNGAVIKAEPTNHITSFNGILGNPAYYYVNLTWIDATGGTEPDGYLIKRSEVGFGDIVDPVDGVPETNTFSTQNIAQGIETAVFTGFASTTYYFKVFPYTNEGSFIDYKIDVPVPEFSITSADAPPLPLTENFEYPTGSYLTDNGWVAHSGAGGFPIDVNDSPLTYGGYLNSGVGKSVTLVNSLALFAEDVNRLYESVSINSIYASFMVNVASSTTDGIYFFHFGQENSTSLFFGKVFVINDGSDNIAFGVAKNSNTAAAYTAFNYSLNTTYLIVVKYTFNTGMTTDDEVKLWINPVLDGIEPPSDLTQTDTQTDPLKLDYIALRQATINSNGPDLTIGGIRVATSWVPEAGASTFNFSVPVTSGWNMVSAPGLNTPDQNVSTWWPNLTGTVWEFNGTIYEARTVTTPGEGYWMKNVGAETYSYTGIEIVTHDVIPATAGWNLIGGYEINVATTGLTTINPTGQQTGTIWGFNGTIYEAATTFEPGKGYWVKTLSACDIVIPEALSKGSGEVVDLFKEDWGKIILTDAAGKSYTLYAVKGEVDLDQYEMPPAVPGGMFDIRFSSGRIAEDINSSMQSIDMSGITYPLTVRVEGMDIRLQDMSGRAINQNLKSGEEVVINDATIQKLMVTGELIPTVYALEQNYPNPFNPSTVIEFSLPEDVSNVKLSIYNALGEKVAEIVNSSLAAGRYSYQWNAKNVATGMYIYELRTDKFVSVKKMILVK